ncbi:MAG: RIO1 family regulatory kinase/ATPase, partial [Micromonosporaceae bacterium]
HGDLSPYNILVDHGRLVLIDVPQIVDVVANPQGPTFLDRDATVVANWFAARGLPGTDALPALLRKEAGLH